MDPTLENYEKALLEFIAEAKANPQKNFLFFQLFASHGYHVGGFQEVATPYFDPVDKSNKLIPVEKLVRAHFMGLSNAYCITHFACCREIKKLSKQELIKLAQAQLGYNPAEPHDDTRGDTV